MTEQTTTAERTWSEEFEVEANKLAENIKSLLKQTDVHRIRVRKQDDTVLLDIPVVAGVAAGGLALYLAPVMTVLGILGGAVLHLKVEVVRRQDSQEADHA